MEEFDFIGFNVSQKFRAEAAKHLRQLLNSVCGVVGHDAYIVRSGTLFEGSIKIQTAWNTFSANCQEETPHEVLQSLIRKMQLQISEWRIIRTPVVPSGRRWLRGIEPDAHDRAS